MYNNILEISSRASKGGRVPIKIALLKIHDDIEETNINGLHWEEEYVVNAMESAIMMPICAEFSSEDKEVPLGHGLTGTMVDENGNKEPEFLNSETVGVIESVSIEDITSGNETIRVLVGKGYLYNQRYPKFVKWVRKNYIENHVDSSIEIMGTEENENKIVFLEENPTDSYRTPQEFIFTGTSLLSVSPADDDAIVLEVAQKKESKKEEKLMEFDMNEIKSVIQATISECNSNDEKFTVQISELNETISAKDETIAEKDAKIAELNATIEEVQKALADLKAEQESYWAERSALEKELGELKAKERLGELSSAIEQFSDAEQKYAEVEINSFKKDPIKGDIDTIVSKIYAGIGQAAKEEEKISEQNSKKHDEEIDIEDIFSEVCSDESLEDEDINIF